MPLSEETLLDLMAYADGELDGAALARVEALIAADADAARVVSEMQGLGACLRVAEAQRPIATDVDAIADAVMAAASKLPAPAPAVVIPMGARRARAGIAGAASIVLAAAAVWAVLRPPDVAPEDTGPIAANVSPAPSTGALAASGVDTGVHGVDVDEVDSPDHAVSVFHVAAEATSAGQAAAASVVVWIPESP